MTGATVSDKTAGLAAGGPPPVFGFAQIAFAGHSRPEDLADPAQIATRLHEVWTVLQAAGLQRARLLCGYADGSDQIAVSTWRETGLGPIQLVAPHLDDLEKLPVDLRADATLLDGTATRARRLSPHLAQSRWIIGATDLLVVVWDGKAPRGSGGTADTVRLALQHGVPVLWIHPDMPFTRLIRPQHLLEDCGFGELIELLAGDAAPIVVAATPDVVRATLVELDLQPDDGAEVPEPGPPLKLAWPWRSYATFRRWLGGKPTPPSPHAPPADLLAQPGFKRLTDARSDAAREAQRLGAMHRSKQVILLAIAIAMATAGSAGAMWPELKLILVSVELSLAISAYLVWRSSERGNHHVLWGEARKAAEDLRLERVAWVLGVSTTPHKPLSNNADAARRARRLAGLPSGPFDADRVSVWGAWVVQELLTGQAGYHRDQARINARISHRLHQAENVSFAVLLLVLALYLVVAIAFSGADGHAPKWLSGLVFMVGAIVPAIGAACLALEATLSIDDQARRSAILARQMQDLGRDLGDSWSLEDLQSAARAAIRLQRAQEDHWSDEAGRRRLFRGG